MARSSITRTPDARLDSPKGLRSRVLPGRNRASRDRFGRSTEAIARGMGTPWFLIILTGFVVLWIGFNTYGPDNLRFDSAAIGFTALTLILSLQASYAAPLILLAQNRQDDRDRVQIEQDRQRAERNLADTEYLAREVVALRLAMQDMASKDFIRGELRALLEELSAEEGGPGSKRPDKRSGKRKTGEPRPSDTRPSESRPGESRPGESRSSETRSSETRSARQPEVGRPEGAETRAAAPTGDPQPAGVEPGSA
ncbi:DUF1003 domain-containing protein [Subtercola sp. PAMC28395]|uniref:DUF1003 domain-containing protein n=1 Tax=Subtercola sp. PAMC28395 TaxID=2846775 RepID=UPI001C0AA176|nr:DUF1003 domain-containing protein [Subtercola sp. PAMC28395]QWT23688.1 DUF1003 domain-containing protein [Subtercola sp. PAMC28395]